MKRHGLTRPWLQKSHPNFFIIFIITLIRQLWSGVNGLLNPHLFDGKANRFLNQAAVPQVWAVGLGISALLMGIGLFCKTFTVARCGLALGLVIMLAQTWFLVKAQLHDIPTANGIPNFLLISGQFLVMTLEPPVNPVTGRMIRHES